nr:tripartite tricarboxylate transporter substrate binding protein [Halomonas socia]
MSEQGFSKIKNAYVAFALFGAITASGVSNADFPTEKSLTLVTPYGAGGGVDITARVLSGVARDNIGTRVDIVNMEGSGGQEAINHVLRSQSDGYTLLITDYGPLITTALRENVNYELEEWAPIATITEVVPTFFTRSDHEIQSVSDWVDYAKENPGSMSVGHGRHLSVPHLPLILFENEAEIENIHIPTTGGSEALAYVLGGTTDFGASVPSTIQSGVEAGNITPIAVASQERVASLPDTPTMLEEGYDVVLPAWYTIFAHRDVPQERREILEEEIMSALNTEEAHSLATQSGVSLTLRGIEESSTAYENTISNIKLLLDDIEDM